MQRQKIVFEELSSCSKQVLVGLLGVVGDSKFGD